MSDTLTAPTARSSSTRGALSWVGRQIREPYVRLLLAQVSDAAVASLANVLMARALAPSGRGWIALLLQISYLGSQLLLLGTERSFIAGYTGTSPAVAVRAYARLILRPCVAGLAVLAVVAVVIPAELRPPWPVLAMVAAYTVVNVAVLAVRAIAIATGRCTGYLRYTVVSGVLLLATMAALHVSGVTRLSAWFGAYLLAGALPTIACWVLWSRATPHEFTAPEDGPGAADRRRAVRREGLALLPAAIANMGMLRVDRLILPALASTAALGLYATVATMTQLIAWPLQAYADSRLGAWRAAHGRGRLRASPIVLSAAVYGLVVAPVLGGGMYLLIVPLFGERYASAKALVPPLVLAAGLYALSRVSLAMLIAQGRNLLASAAETCGFVASLVAYVVLIPTHGALGAAYGSLLGYAVCLAFAGVAVRGGTERRDE